MTDPLTADVRLALIVRHPDRSEILTVDRSDGTPGWTLPSLLVNGDGPVRAWISSVRAYLGVPAVMLRHEFAPGLDGDEVEAFLAELEPTVPLSTDGVWRPVPSLPIDAADGALRGAIERWRMRSLSGTVSKEMPWSRPGWVGEASSWMLESLAAAGWEPIGTPEQHYLWSLTSILRCPTTAGDTYLKATSPLFAQEVAMTQLLATRTPGLTPAVLATEPGRGWLLMADHGGRPLDEEPQTSWPLGIATHARIQRAWLGDLAAARAAGAVERGLDAVAEAAKDLASNDSVMGRLDPASRLRYERSVPRLIDACARIDAAGLPDTLIHGDLHPGNVAVTDRGCIVFDWSDVAIGNPLIDLVPYLNHGSDAASRRMIRDAYVAVWADMADPHRLRDAADAALPVGCFYQVMGYLTILGRLGADDVVDLAGADLDWIGRTMRALDDGIESRAL